ncbi:ATP-binding protein [Streptomyces sp. V4-01]|uniref:ATP-binding protein n=1 Tax=Actinacidiphila polyblastidii TaxID=3110430 RepID=A0ABU7P5N7_9ACTN|nr:ATP-binding protein [Streptomyces sp. V4-01]
MVAQEVPTSTTMALPHGPTGVADARRRLRTDLYAHEVPDTVVDDAVLIISELLSNSCRHARPLGDADAGGEQAGQAGAQAPAGRFRTGARADAGPGAGAARTDAAATRTEIRPAPAGAGVLDPGIRAAWSVGEDGLLVLEVTDGGGPTRPHPASPSLTAHGGRGLGIVGSLALRWGVRDAPGEVTVWAVLPVRGRHARRDEPAGTGIGLPRGVPLDLPLDLAESLDDLG